MPAEPANRWREPTAEADAIVRAAAIVAGFDEDLVCTHETINNRVQRCGHPMQMAILANDVVDAALDFALDGRRTRLDTVTAARGALHPGSTPWESAIVRMLELHLAGGGPELTRLQVELLRDYPASPIRGTTLIAAVLICMTLKLARNQSTQVAN